MPQFSKKENAPDFSKESVQKSFIQDTHDSKSLMQKELNVNQAEQELLKKRLEMMRSFLNDLSSSDPQYSMILTQIQMDQIEMNELKIRESILIQNISK